jgi:putative flippase GtrA
MTDTSLSPDAARRAGLAAFLRYGVVGIGITAFGAGVYWAAVEWAGMAPLVANSVAFVLMLVMGYGLHSRWSFRGHGSRDAPARRGARFLAVNILAYALNALWVWTLVERLGGPTWWPVVPMIFVTPVVSFVLHRLWTFR